MEFSKRKITVITRLHKRITQKIGEKSCEIISTKKTMGNVD